MNNNEDNPKIGNQKFPRIIIEDEYIREKPPTKVNKKPNSEWSTWGACKTILVGYLATWISVVLFFMSFFLGMLSIAANTFSYDLFSNEFWEIISLSIAPLILLLSISLVIGAVSKYRGSIISKIALFLLVLVLWALSIGVSFWLLIDSADFSWPPHSMNQDVK